MNRTCGIGCPFGGMISRTGAAGRIAGLSGLAARSPAPTAGAPRAPGLGHQFHRQRLRRNDVGNQREAHRDNQTVDQ